MTRMSTLLVALLCLATACATLEAHALSLDDPLARRVVSSACHQAEMLGPYDAQVSIFSVPEPTGEGHRLYVGLVDDLLDRDSPVHVWRGPVAAGWEQLGPVPEHTPLRSVSNPLRYRVLRKGRASGGRQADVLMEIDLETKPARLKFVALPPGGVTSTGDLQFDAITPLSESMKLLPRLRYDGRHRHGGQQVVSYRIVQGYAKPPAKRPHSYEHWETPMETHLLLVSMIGDPERTVAHFLPRRPGGWMLRGPMPDAVARKHPGRFALEMFAEYLIPDKEGKLVLRSARHLVTVGMEGLSITTLELGYLYDVGSETWIKLDHISKPKKGSSPEHAP